MPAPLPAPEIDFIDNFARWLQAESALESRLQAQLHLPPMPLTEPPAGAEALPGLQVQDSDWSAWEAAGHPRP